MADVVPIGPLSKETARALTDEVKAGAHALWTKLLRLFEGDAHKALGYKSWGQYYEAEFGGSMKEASRMLAAGRVLESLEPAGFRGEGTHGSPLLTESGARELQPLLQQGARAVQEAYEEAVERSNGEKPTARVIRDVVRQLRPDPAPKPAPRVRLDAAPEPMPVAPPDPEPPAWTIALGVQIEALTSGIQWWLAGGCFEREENLLAVAAALGQIGALKVLLEEIANSVDSSA